jgi:hypothetical protein
MLLHRGYEKAAEGQPQSKTFGVLRRAENTLSVVDCGFPSAAFGL